MQKRFLTFLLPFVALVLAVVGMVGANFAFAQGSKPASHPATSAQRAVSHVVAMHTVNMQQVPAETASQAASAVHAKQMPWLTGMSPAAYAQLKAAAAHNKNAPVDTSAIDSIDTPSTTAKFAGQGDTCGCQPPDQALAASSSWVFQGVNTSFAVYNTSGTRQAGWPKTSVNFFGIPNPSPSGCASSPFTSDPRAFYDPKDGRFWAAMLEVEGAFGVNTNCTEVTRYWIAVSQTGNPNGAWFVYAFNMAITSGTGACPTCAADYTQFGFDQTAMYFSGNMFNQSGTSYAYAETFAALKSTMEAGSSVTAYGFYGFTANGVAVDTVQPVENEASSGPGVGLLINSFDANGDGTHNCRTTACSGVVVWAIANPGKSTTSASGIVVSTKSYILPPQATEPGCSGCIDTNDTRISGTPVYQQGLISFSLNTGVNNGTQVVPAAFWGQVKPTISGGTITGGSIFQSGNIHFSGNRAAFFGALMATSSGNLLMVFDTMSSSINPSIMYATRLTTDTKGKFEKALYLKKGSAATVDQRWGDYEATSYDGSSNNTWFSAQYSNGDWATYIGKVNF
jgi:hypothetical protein